MKKECEICGDKSYKATTFNKIITMHIKHFDPYEYWRVSWSNVV